MRLKVLIISPQCDGEDVGETWNAFHWISRLSKVCDLTVLTMRRPRRKPPSEQLPGVRVIEWGQFPELARFPKLVGALKPWYPAFYVNARRWILKSLGDGEQFDLIHQLTPLALRFPCPARGLGVPYIVGPLAGSLSTPPGFEKETGSAPIYTRLRLLDSLRFKWDPLLRGTFQEAELLLCSSPYVEDILAPVHPKRCEVFCEVGIEPIAPARERKREPGELRLVHVGRAVRTKGLRDAVRAISLLKDLPKVTLDVAGSGEETELCKAEAERLGVSDRIKFHGRLPRDEVDALYRRSDVFLFPSFREPTGIVLFEAMNYGLPVITTDRGGPGYVVDDSCGIQVSPINPDQFARDIAQAIRTLVDDPMKLSAMRKGALSRTAEIGHWDGKISRMMEIYTSIAKRH